MSDRYPGGIVVANPTAPTPYSAPGIWTLEQQAYYQAQGLWPSPSTQNPDPYFDYVTLLLTGNGANGAQNSTFIDSSTNAVTFTRIGNTTQGSFNPYGSNWSNARTNSSTTAQENLTATLPSTLGSGDFTIECWINRSVNTGTYSQLLSQSGNVNFVVGLYPSGGEQYLSFYNGIDGWGTNGTTAIKSGTWYHIAIVRSGSTLKGYLNGVLEFSYSISVTFDETNLTIMSRWAQSISPIYWAPLVGYISNVRIVKGTAVYSGSSFTVPTTPLTAISGTQILTCQSNRFIDNSSNNLTITPNGSPSVQRFSPFNPTAPYTTATVGGSGYFDGSGDYLSTPDTSAYTFGTSDFTIEAWVYANNFTLGTNTIFGDYGGGPSGKYIFYASAGKLSFYSYPTGSIDSTINIPTNAWTHVAVTRMSNVFYLWQNGVQVAVWSQTISLTGSGTNAQIGAYWQPSNVEPTSYWNGYISNLRIVKGTAVYTSGFTPPTTPLTAISGTTLLTNFTNAGIPDSAMMNDLETVGNAQVSTSQSKFGTGSISLPGSTSYLKTSADASLPAFGTGDFTIEFWAYWNSTSGDQCLIDFRPTSTDGAYPMIYANGSTIWYYTNTAQRITGSGAVGSATTWYHIALCRSGTSTKLFVNGTQVGSTYSDSTNYLGVANRPFVGIWAYDLTGSFNGYIDDLRITKGYARYTANFTPPTLALPTY